MLNRIRKFLQIRFLFRLSSIGEVHIEDIEETVQLNIPQLTKVSFFDNNIVVSLIRFVCMHRSVTFL